jgi:hypothetical protein
MGKDREGTAKDHLRSVYDARSDFVHKGIRLPPSIVFGLMPSVSSVAGRDFFKHIDETNTLPLPPFVTLERLVSYSMVVYLERGGTHMPSLPLGARE